ncbi:hypothetical protein M0812_20078 [Anaeramoeba flamelloides]|uniref:F-box domain-containing protein n=1 Tax=Anaeramoeba flamelloides TaxID=1746091 RepID=A0AAV7Z337_9EUKA|nr:hypothetical protein M0812_20078 [Anaeramoeba flamelloides]
MIDNFSLSSELLHETELHRYVNYRQETVLYIGNYNWNDFVFGKIGPIQENPTEPPSENELSLDQLPDPILFNIFSYLPPIKLLYLQYLSSVFFDVVDDQELWRELSYQNDSLFIWEKLMINTSDLEMEKKLVKIYGTLNKELHDELEKRLEGYNSSEEDNKISNQIGNVKINSVKRIRLDHISQLQSPKEILVDKLKQIKSIEKQKQDFVRKNQKRYLYNKSVREFWSGYWAFIRVISVFLIFFIIPSTILMNIFVVNKAKRKYQFWAIFPLLLLLGFIFFKIMGMLFVLFKTNKKLQSSEMNVLFLVTLFTVSILLLLFKSVSMIGAKWTFILIPFEIFFLICVVKEYCLKICFKPDSENIGEFISFLPILSAPLAFFIFVIILALKLDNYIDSNWAYIFIPIFYIHAIPFISAAFEFLSCCIADDSESVSYLYFVYILVFGVILLPLLISEILLVFYLDTLLDCRIEDLSVENDQRMGYFIDHFGYKKGGIATLEVSNFKFDFSYVSKTDKVEMGLTFLPIENVPSSYGNEEPIPCTYLQETQDPTQYLVKKSQKEWETGFTEKITIQEDGLYGLYFRNCEADLNTVSYDLKMTMHNFENYLSIGETELPSIYMLFSFCYVTLVIIWGAFLRYKKKTAKITKLHYLFTVLLITKMFAMISKAVEFYFLAKTGAPKGWNVPYYFFAICKGILLIVVILVLGTGYSSIKSSLSDREKKIFMFVIPLQIMTNVALIIVEETSPGTQSYFTWWDLLKFFDIICVCSILFPIIWSINHLKNTASVDGKQAKNLQKLTLFKQFYLITVFYIYFTRIIVVLFSNALSYKYLWVSKFADEISTLIFFTFVGYKFRPYPENVYVRIYEDDEDDFTDDDLPMFLNNPLEDNTITKREIRPEQEIEDSEVQNTQETPKKSENENSNQTQND